jgi:hypothetical protein
MHYFLRKKLKFDLTGKAGLYRVNFNFHFILLKYGT